MRHCDPPNPARRRCLAVLAALGVGGWLGSRLPIALGSGGNDQLIASMRRLYGEQGVAKLQQWMQLEAQLRSHSDNATKLREINDFFNRHVLWTDDIEIKGVEDYWMTPLETLGEGRGDCEDYTIAKYVALRRLGIGDDRLRLIYVRARLGRSSEPIAHMVLGYFPAPNTEPLILDNIVGSIQPAARRTDLFPVFSFNSEGLWAGGSSQSRADPLARLSRWRSVLERMRQQGFD
ncbi:transglutaminase-like cysteine peptidase [Kushneria aurantia]|uniref:Transglutaminase-like cysteine peptidase n=1 Tax=Kushneria aurantia TaxID=504092 RepID=A0ABV6G6A0_9GAMM|nr:transglutaminase-like cysteine peptidase [Kushneria aurantia]